ncbi:hypothetical protein WJ39_17905 [Burkholderia diffusa]|nr:hypothetical protein WJ39_17905 [Burkholderia diffusa]
MADHTEAGRYIFQLLGDVVAEGLHGAAARRAGFARFRPVRQNLPGQMIGERFARRLFWCGTRRLQNFAGGSAFVGLELFQSQLELLDLTVELLGTPAELHAAQFRDQQLQMLNLCLGGCVRRLVRFDHVFQMPNACIALKLSTSVVISPEGEYLSDADTSSMALSASTSSG